MAEDRTDAFRQAVRGVRSRNKLPLSTGSDILP